MSTIRLGTTGSNPDENQPATSTNTSAAAYEYTHTSPVESTGTKTEFGSTAPAPKKFTFDASGIGDPHGHTVKNPHPSGSTAVTFNATALAPDTGTPPTPATGTRKGIAGNTRAYGLRGILSTAC